RLPPQNTRTVHNLTPSLRISPLYPYTTLFRSHVDWSSVAERAEAHGVHVGGFTDQHHFITGIISELPAPLEDADAKTKRALQTLLHPEILGRAFQVLALAKDVAASTAADSSFKQKNTLTTKRPVGAPRGEPIPRIGCPS